ncbi:SDR family oxidoreductase [Pedobacter sp. SYP-B3415]|uniref:SDR family oxidoreductase n=1 Tax=Pedobacter sp. SYP-B3415 TaxID=2496641 RepID=UPI00101C09D6|nr:SDR family oxidoreductase [Pedobacter sp. SYP-B3415]
MKKQASKKIRPEQSQSSLPGKESEMRPDPDYQPRATRLRLERKVALITGGDSGIGRAVALAYAKEGADLVLSYLSEDDDAKTTEEAAREFGAKVLLVRGDISDEKHCKHLIGETIREYGQLDILVNNAAIQYPQESIEKITAIQLHKTFATNIFAQFYLCKAALPHLKAGSNIICTTSVTAYRGSGHLIDYASTKGAIVSFVRSLSASLAQKNIRVNGVAPGPVWTPLIPATFPADHVSEFGSDVPMGRAAEPNEIAPAYVFLGSDDASYITGQIIHPNGGEIINT